MSPSPAVSGAGTVRWLVLLSPPVPGSARRLDPRIAVKRAFLRAPGVARARAWRRTIAGITVPTLWLQGGEDPLARPGPARALAATRPDGTFELRPGVGHLLALEDPAWTADRIGALLADSGPDSGLELDRDPR